MARSLVVIGIAGLAVSAVCLSLASLISPDGSYSYPYWSRGHCDGGWRGSRPWSGRTPFAESGASVTRDFAWTGGDRVDICIPGTVYYEPGPEWRVTVTGPESGVESLRIEGGEIYFDASGRHPQASSLEVRITGPALESFGLRGSGALILENIAQDDLEIDLYGSGSVRGHGKVGNLELRIFGSGNVDLAKLATGDADTKLFGSGNADLAPTGDVDVVTFGSGDVRLHSRPKRVSTKAFGSGRTVQLDDGRDGAEGTRSTAPVQDGDGAIRL